MTLFRDSNEFGPTLDAAAERLEISATAIEKDYWVSQILFELARGFGNDFIFKGGTSLSKAYRIVERFSEDIDVLVLPAQRGRGTTGQAAERNGCDRGLGHRRRGVSSRRIRNRSASLLRSELPSDTRTNRARAHERPPRDGCAGWSSPSRAGSDRLPSR